MTVAPVTCLRSSGGRMTALGSRQTGRLRCAGGRVLLQDTERASHSVTGLARLSGRPCLAVGVRRIPSLASTKLFETASFKPLLPPCAGPNARSHSTTNCRAGRILHLDAGGRTGAPGAGHASLGVHGLRAHDLARDLVDEEGATETHAGDGRRPCVVERPRRPACLSRRHRAPWGSASNRTCARVMLFATQPINRAVLATAAHHHHPVPDVLRRSSVPSGSGRRNRGFRSSLPDQPQAAIGEPTLASSGSAGLRASPSRSRRRCSAVCARCPARALLFKVGHLCANAGGTGPRRNAGPPTRPALNGGGTADDRLWWFLDEQSPRPLR